MKVFVYGSLKKGYWNHRCLEKNNSKFLGNSITFGYKLYHVSSFPGMIKSNNPFEIVHGETYMINEETLEMLDKLEGEGLLYKRHLLTAFNGIIPIKAYAYLYLPEIHDDIEMVKNNNWKGNPIVKYRHYK